MFIADTHCHILYGVDDGAKDREEMFEMLDRAYENGVRFICATPHYNPELFRYDPEGEETAFRELCGYAAETYPEMRLLKGNEVFVYVKVPSFITEKKGVCLAGTNRLLVEFVPSVAFPVLESSVSTIFTTGFVPVLAHVERYPCLSEKRIAELKHRGAIVTVNAASVIGKNGFRCRRLVRKLIKHGIVDIVVSDAHSPSAYDHLFSAYATTEKKYGSDVAEALFRDNVYRIYRIGKHGHSEDNSIPQPAQNKI